MQIQTRSNVTTANPNPPTFDWVLEKATKRDIVLLNQKGARMRLPRKTLRLRISPYEYIEVVNTSVEVEDFISLNGLPAKGVYLYHKNPKELRRMAGNQKQTPPVGLVPFAKGGK